MKVYDTQIKETKCFQPTDLLDQREDITSHWNLGNLEMAKI